MQQLGTCLPTAEADRVLCRKLMMFKLYFSIGCTKCNTAAIKILLLLMAGLFIGFVVCFAFQSHRESDDFDL